MAKKRIRKFLITIEEIDDHLDEDPTAVQFQEPWPDSTREEWGEVCERRTRERRRAEFRARHGIPEPKVS